MREYLKDATQIQIYGGHIQDTEFNEEYSKILEDVVKGLPEDIKIILVEHNRGSPDSAEKRLLYYDETTHRWIFSHAGTRKNTGKFIYLPKTAFLELSRSKSGKKFLAKLIFDEIEHADAKLAGYWSEDYHRNRDKELRRFVIDYLGDRLYPKYIRQAIHEIDSIEMRIGSLDSIIADVDKILNKVKTIVTSGNESTDEALMLLENLELRLKDSRSTEKKEALVLIASVRKDLLSGNRNKILSRLISARAKLNSYLNILFRQVNVLEGRLKKQISYIKKTGVQKEEGPGKDFLEAVSEEFKDWDNAEGAGFELYNKIIKFYSIWFSKGERVPPSLSLIYRSIRDKRIKE